MLVSWLGHWALRANMNRVLAQMHQYVCFISRRQKVASTAQNKSPACCAGMPDCKNARAAQLLLQTSKMRVWYWRLFTHVSLGSLWPSWPLTPRPQLNTSPASVTANVWRHPHDSSFTGDVPKPSTRTGALLSAFEPIPSCPNCRSYRASQRHP